MIACPSRADHDHRKGRKEFIMHTKRFVLCLVGLCIAGAISTTTALNAKERPGTPPFINASSPSPAGVYCPTEEQIGRLLFFDTNLSSPTGRSCASCHNPSTGFADPNAINPVSVGSLSDIFGNRNAPTVSYCKHSPTFHYDATSGTYIGGQFWDGRAATLEDQARSPFINPLEMNNYSLINVVDKVKMSSYANLFKELYGNDCFNDPAVAYGMIASAISAYERSREVNPFSSKYDQYLSGLVPLSRREALGLAIFEGKGGCSGCHPSEVGSRGAPPLFTDFSYHNVGVPRNPYNPYYNLPARLNPWGDSWLDCGLGGFLDTPGEMGKMKVPTLRNVALTAPYSHNGIFKSLRGMVEFCANRNLGYHLEPEIPENVNLTGFGNAGLRDREIDAVVAFLNTLSDGYVRPVHKDPGEPMLTPTTPAIGADAALSIAPNPFNPATQVEFTLVGPATVRMAVYDVTGRLVRSLVNEDLPAGVHAATWDGTDAGGASVASGIYFIRLTTGNQTTVKKAVLTR
jgi:cytochrome c peroxidase